MSLPVISRHTLSKPVDVDKTVVCSPHELIAIVTHTHDVIVYRLNGQVAFTIKNEEEARVNCLEWSPDGKRLAIAWNDGTWKIHENSEAVYEGEGEVSAMSWLECSQESDYISSIALLDITSVLPRLSALPAHGLRSNAESVKFANQSATDVMFTNQKQETVLLLYGAGHVKVMLNGTSNIGVATRSSEDVICDGPVSIGKVMEVLEIPHLGNSVQVASRSATQLTALMQYIKRTAQCIDHDIASCTVPSRFKRSISDSLEDNLSSNSTFISAMMQLCLTGQFHADVLEWLTDIVNLKRWDTAVTTMYSSVQTHLHQNILPALDRMSIATTIEPVLAAIDDLREDTMEVLAECIELWSQWRAFAKALKMWIEIAGAGPGSKEAAEIEERYTIDHMAVLKYLRVLPLESLHIKTLEDAVTNAITAISTWQGELFTATKEYDSDCGRVLDVQAGEIISILSEDNGVISLLRVEAGKPAEVVWSKQAVDAKFCGPMLVCLADELVVVELATLDETAHPMQATRILAGGRANREFAVCFSKGLRSWTVLDLADRANYVDPRMEVRQRSPSVVL